METTDDVLVVIQAESGEEIALPLAALDEQHQEVIVDEFRNEPIEKPAAVKVFRPKQKRKEKLIYLPLTEEDLKLEFQVIDEPSPQQIEETKKRPRREYRTRKKLAALEAANNDNETAAPTPTADIEDECQNIKDSSQTSIKEEPDPKLDHENRTELASPRRTRLSNACRVATSKMYKCTECDFTTERINNIVMHMKESCHKMGKS